MRGEIHGANWCVVDRSTLFLLLVVAAMCIASQAQTDRQVTVRMLDSDTGEPIISSDLEVWADHVIAVDLTRGKPNKDGIATAVLPTTSSVVAVHAQYDRDMYYANCDAEKDQLQFTGHWYSVAEILAKGVAAPNLCNSRKATAKKGEFVFFVRRQHWWERMRE